MIEIKNLHKSYEMGSSSLHVLKGIDFSVNDGELVAIMGSSGSGKSTLLNILGMLDNSDNGTYDLDKIRIADMDEKKAANYRNKFLGFVFQSFNLINYKNALENVALPLYYQGIPRKERQVIALNYLDKVGLKDWSTHLPSELSGGQKQRVAIARALASNPKVLLLDEPFAGIDPIAIQDLKQLIMKLSKDGLGILISDHNVKATMDICEEVFVINNGKIISSGNPKEVSNNEIVKKVYLGDMY